MGKDNTAPHHCTWNTSVLSINSQLDKQVGLAFIHLVGTRFFHNAPFSPLLWQTLFGLAFKFPDTSNKRPSLNCPVANFLGFLLYYSLILTAEVERYNENEKM